MGAVALALLYAASALVLALLVRWLLAGAEEGTGTAWSSVLVLTVLPLVFTGEAFLPGRTLAPTNTLTSAPPWVEPERKQAVLAASSAENPFLLDPLAQMLPWRQAARRGLLFNPSQGGGAALLANGQSAVLFPTEVAARLLPPSRANGYSQAVRLLLAAWGMFLLVRWLGPGEVAALAAAAVWVGSAFLQIWRLHPHSLVAALLPWILAAVVALVRAPRPRTAMGLAAGGALAVFAGHPETLLHGLIFAAAVGGLLLAGEARRRGWRGGWRHGGRAVAYAAVAALLAFLLAAPALLPFAENLEVAAKGELRAETSFDRLEAPWPEVARRLAPALTPWAYGDPLDPGWRRGPRAGAPEAVAELAGGAVGAAGLLLAFLGLFAGGRSLRPAPAWWLLLGLLGLLVAAHAPGLSRPFGAVPVLDVTLLKRLSLWWCLAAAVLAAAGVEALRDPEGRRSRGRRALAAAAAMILALLAVAAGALPAARAGSGLGLEAASLVVALLAALAVTGLPRHGARVAAVGFAVALLLPRGLLFARWVPSVPADSFYPETLAIQQVRQRLDQLPPWGYRVAGLDAALLPHAAAFYGFAEVRANDPMTFAPYERYLATLGEPRRQTGPRILGAPQPGLDFLGVRFVFDHPSMTDRPGLATLWPGRDARVYENPGALPRVFVPREVEVFAEPAAALVAGSAEGEPGRRVAVSGDDLPAPGVHANGAAEVTHLEVAPGHLKARVRAPAPAVVATSQPAIPGWRLWLDGEEQEPLLVNGAFLGVAVAAGDSRLELRYAPRSFACGLALAGVGGVLVLLLVGLEARSRRRGAGAVP